MTRTYSALTDLASALRDAAGAIIGAVCCFAWVIGVLLEEAGKFLQLGVRRVEITERTAE